MRGNNKKQARSLDDIVTGSAFQLQPDGSLITAYESKCKVWSKPSKDMVWTTKSTILYAIVSLVLEAVEHNRQLNKWIVFILHI